MKQVHLTQQEQAAVLGHMQAARIAFIALANILRPAVRGGKINVTRAQEHARRVASNTGHLLVWLNTIDKESRSHGTDLTSHL